MKTPPDRTGIKFEVGAQLQARDRHKNWYSATIEKIDYDKERVQVHYRQWSRRHDEWFQWNSPYLRPLERVSLRRRGLTQTSSSTSFVSGTKVMACWTDCRFYPAKILQVNKDDSYTVRFYDGVVRTVRPTKVKPFQRKLRREKTAVGSEGWEEGESEEEQEAEGGEEVEEEEEKEEKKEDEGEKEGSTESERRPQASSSSSPPPAKKRIHDTENSDAHKQPITSELSPPAVPNPAHIDKDVLLERQAHLPTTHKFSREPLYRVIKNQPPPILSIELDHNPFKCPSAGCTKSFRKASLLHYHIKYYHSEQQQQQQPDEQSSASETPRRKRSTSEGGHFLYDTVTCHHDDRELGTSLTEVKKETTREKSHHDRKERKDFLRVKLKKKKKRKKKKKKRSQAELCSSDDDISALPPVAFALGKDHHGVDDGSDWSTLTAESGEDTPFWSVAMETEDCEVVRCVCEVDEENDFMIQCESCLCWQHGTCMGLYENNIPHNYICYYCRHCTGWRRAQRYQSEPDLLSSGRMFGLSCVRDNYSEVNASKITLTSGLLAHTHGLHQVLSGLQLKISLLHAPSHPDLQLWRLPWRQEETQKPTDGPRGETHVSYVSSEHCYQKPGASWENKKRDETEKDWPMVSVKLEPHDDQKEVKKEEENTTLCGDADWHGGAKGTKHTGVDEHTHYVTSATECQLNLLDHVECLHQQICTRMDLVEKDLDVLESWLDHSGELEPPEPLSRLPQLKQRIRRLLCELSVVRRLSVCHCH